MILTNLLMNINEKKWQNIESILAASTGKDFEAQIERILMSDSSYQSISKNEYQNSPFYARLKKVVLSSKNHDEIIKTKGINKYFRLNDKRILIRNPYGANNYPDFMLIVNDKILPLEIKFSTKSGDKPTWNGGYPRSKSIYIFGSYGLRDISAFVGDDYLNSPQRIALLWVANTATKAMELEAQKNPHISSKWFYPYMRAMYIQRFSTLKIDKRDKFEKNAIALSTSGPF